MTQQTAPPTSSQNGASAPGPSPQPSGTPPNQAPGQPTPSPQPSQAPVPAGAQAPVPQAGLGETLVGWVKRLLQPHARVVDTQPNTVQQTIGQLAIDADMPIAQIVEMLVNVTGDTAEVIESFDEEKEHFVGRIIVQVGIILAYVFPAALGIWAGFALAAKYTNNAPLFADVTTVYMNLLCLGYEIGLVLLMIASVRQARRVLNTGGKGILFAVGIFAVFGILAYLGAQAQWIFFEGNINMQDHAQVIGASIRTYGAPIVDFMCAIALTVLYRRSLDSHLATIQKKADAVIAINRKKVAAQLEIIGEAIQTKSDLQKERDYQAKNDLANTIISMFSDNAIEMIAEALKGGRASGNGYRRDYSR